MKGLDLSTQMTFKPLDIASRSNAANTIMDQYQSPLANDKMETQPQRRMQTQMDFYKKSKGDPLTKMTTDSFAAGSQRTKLDFFRSNNLGRVSEHFMNSLMNNHPL